MEPTVCLATFRWGTNSAFTQVFHCLSGGLISLITFMAGCSQIWPPLLLAVYKLTFPANLYAPKKTLRWVHTLFPTCFPTPRIAVARVAKHTPAFRPRSPAAQGFKFQLCCLACHPFFRNPIAKVMLCACLRLLTLVIPLAPNRPRCPTALTPTLTTGVCDHGQRKFGSCIARVLLRIKLSACGVLSPCTQVEANCTLLRLPVVAQLSQVTGSRASCQRKKCHAPRTLCGCPMSSRACGPIGFAGLGRGHDVRPFARPASLMPQCCMSKL